MIEEEENNKYEEKVKQLSATIDVLKEELKGQRKECRKKHFKALRRAIQLLLYHLRKCKHRKKRQRRGYIPVRWFQKFNFFEKISSVSTIIFGGITVWLLFNQNDLISNQNKRVDQQTYLQEAERRSALVFLMGNIFDEVSVELKDEKNKKGQLSPQLINRLASLSHVLIPYKLLEGGQLTGHDYSIERGQLLLLLTKSGINYATLEEIYSKSNFTHSYLVDMDLSNAYLHGINLTTSNMNDANLNGADLSYANLTNVMLVRAKLDSANLSHSKLYKTVLFGTEHDNINFTSAELDSLKILKGDSI